jgi:hypothetical protein
MVLGSEGEARRLMLSVLPTPDTRHKCIVVFADAIEEANRHGRDVWAVTHTRDKVRLIVGHIIVCTQTPRGTGLLILRRGSHPERGDGRYRRSVPGNAS